MDLFILLCKKELNIEVKKEFRFHPIRKWRFDYAVPDKKIAIEVEGGVWTYGRHNRASGFIKDMEKYNTAAEMGWRVLRFTPDDLLKTNTLNTLRNAIKQS
ncbi:MAG TPA: DUF559 domain-containing protein [Bacteroidales bacterium]|jgi:very-short-patch-repair endonuclease|nr:DUF559 domain-containing protein [Bacteroidales bacterium]HPD25102.1 DUF559 domain-containing protein [Bacteroidales bacterium]